MTADDKNYETYILKQVINNYLDKTLSANDEDALNTLLYQCDDLVWKIATAIYSQSGHKVEFALVRDLATSRIEPLKINVAKQKAEQARLKAIEEAQKAEAEAQRKAREEALRVEEEKRKAREEAQKAEAEAQRKVREEARKAEAEAQSRAKEQAQRLKAQTEAQRKAIEEALQAEDKALFIESGGDIHMFELFLKMKKIIIEQLEVKPDCVTLDRVISNSSISTENAYLDIIEFVMVLEEELDIEIPDEIMEHHTTPLCGSYTIDIRELLYSIYDQSLLQK